MPFKCNNNYIVYIVNRKIHSNSGRVILHQMQFCSNWNSALPDNCLENISFLCVHWVTQWGKIWKDCMYGNMTLFWKELMWSEWKTIWCTIAKKIAKWLLDIESVLTFKICLRIQSSYAPIISYLREEPCWSSPMPDMGESKLRKCPSKRGSVLKKVRSCIQICCTN